jgi:hypothetical protein
MARVNNMDAIGGFQVLATSPFPVAIIISCVLNHNPVLNVRLRTWRKNRE